MPHALEGVLETPGADDPSAAEAEDADLVDPLKASLRGRVAEPRAEVGRGAVVVPSAVSPLAMRSMTSMRTSGRASRNGTIQRRAVGAIREAYSSSMTSRSPPFMISPTGGRTIALFASNMGIPRLVVARSSGRRTTVSDRCMLSIVRGGEHKRSTPGWRARLIAVRWEAGRDICAGTPSASPGQVGSPHTFAGN